MRLMHAARIEAPPERVWAIVRDVARTARLVPGVGSVEPLGPGRWRGTLRVQVGPVRLDLAGDVEMTARDDAGRTASLRVAAADRVLGGAVRATTRLEVLPADGASELRVEAEAQVLGRVGELGEPIMRRKAERILSDLAASVAREAAL